MTPTSEPPRLIVDLVRHGEALPASPGGDAERPLSMRGRRDVERLAAALRASRTRWTHVFASPLARARETAGILLEAAETAPAPVLASWLVPEADPGDVLAEWRARGLTEGHVLVVSHQPLIGRLASLLTGAPADFRPGSFQRISFDAEPGPRLGHLTRSIHPGS